MKKQVLTLLTLLFCVALSAQTVDVRVCHADKFIAGCTVYDRADGNQTGIPVDLGDKSYTLNLSWGTPATFAYTDSFAVGGNYLFGCQTLTTAGTYYDTLTTSTGCDSIVVLTLTEYIPCEEVTFAYTDSMATGGTYIFNCQVLTEAGEYRDTLVKADGCDSIIVLTLKEYTPVPPCEEVTFAYTDSMATGGTYIFQCRELTEAGEYRDTLVKADGCDSIIVLTLKEYTTVIQNDTLRDTVLVNLCLGEPFTDRLNVTYYPTQDTIVLDTIMISRDTTLTLIHTVDSIYRYDLHVWPAMTTTEQTDSLCATYGSFTWSLGSRDSIITDFVIGENHREYMYQNILGCDSAKFILDVAVWPAMTTTTQTDSLCATYGSFTWSLGSRDSIITDFVVGDNHREYMYQNILGCDSAKFVLDVAVWPAMTTTEQTDSLCATYGSFTWSLGSRDSIITDFVVGENHREYMYQNILGCDSAKFILDVAVWPAAKDEPTKYDTILVDNLPYIWSTYTDKTIACYTADTYRDTAFNILGCDSIRYALELAIIAHDTITLPVEANLCHGETYTSRWQEVTPRFVGDTTFSDTVPSIMMNPLLMRDSIYAYTLHVQSRYIDELPALVKDDSWLLMIHRRSIREDYGIDFTADQVHWYRVEGEVDEYPYGEDNDVQVGTGDYYTIAQKMSGKYYALLDVDVSWKNACALFARTVILDCDNPSGPVLSPTIVPAGGLMKLTNLKEGELTINVYTPAGQKVRSESVRVDNEHDIYAERVCGVYLLQVTNVGKTNVFKYVVTQ